MQSLCLALGFFLILFTGHAVARKGFWIVKGPEQNCTIVETEPAPTQTAIEKLGKSRYDTREEAEDDLDRVCRSR